MRGTTVFVVASFMLPIFAVPLPSHTVISQGSEIISRGADSLVERHSDVSLAELLRNVFRRDPIIEALPESTYDIIPETRRDVSLPEDDEGRGHEDIDAIEDEDEEQLDVEEADAVSEPLDERGIIRRPGGGAKRGLIRRPGGSAKRGLIRRPGGSAKRGLIRRPGGSAKRGLIRTPGGSGKRGLVERTMSYLLG